MNASAQNVYVVNTFDMVFLSPMSQTLLQKSYRRVQKPLCWRVLHPSVSDFRSVVSHRVFEENSLKRLKETSNNCDACPLEEKMEAWPHSIQSFLLSICVTTLQRNRVAMIKLCLHIATSKFYDHGKFIGNSQ